MLRIHVGRVLATILLIITALLVAAALRSHASGASDTTSLLGAPPAQLSLTPVEPPHPRTSGFNGTAWCGGLLQTKEADAADACTAGVVLLNLFVLLCCFLALAIICDDYLVPPIEHFCERYQIPDEAAGASFLAFGSSAPEIVIASIATLGGAAPDDPDGDETGLSTVLGSAVLAFGLIPGVSALLAPPPGLRNHSPRANDVDGDFPPELDKGGLLLEIRPLIRDVSFTIIGFSLIFLFGADGLVSRAEALAVHQLPFQIWTQEPNTMSVSTLKMRWDLISSSTRRVSSCAPPQLGRACPWIRPRTHSRSTLPHPFRTRALKSIATTSNGSQWVQGGSSNRPDVFVGSLFLGTFQLAFDDHWTDHLPFGSSEADIQGALSALPSIREVHVGRSDGAEHGHAWAVTLSPTARRIDGGEAVTNYVVQWNVADNFREVVANTGSMRVAAQEIDSTAVW